MANKEEIQRRVEVMQAWLDGKTIEVHKLGVGWGQLSFPASPAFDWERCNYRIAKEKKTYWLYVAGNSTVNSGRRYCSQLYVEKPAFGRAFEAAFAAGQWIQVTIEE